MILFVSVSCTTPTLPPATPTPEQPRTPSPTPSPVATPTATPIPPVLLTLHWPERISALEPVSLTLNLKYPAEITETAAVTASVFDPEGTLYQKIRLQSQGNGGYIAREALQFPLELAGGFWKLSVGVLSSFPVTGTNTLDFRPTPLAFHELSGTLHSGAVISVPEAFKREWTTADPRAGMLRWTYGDQVLELWWTPGAAEPLLYNQALVMLTATHDPEADPTILDFEETTWKGEIAFRFRERWVSPRRSGAETWVIQGADHWYYVLRMKNLDGETLPPLLQMIGETFTPAPKP